jgi:hypothetical protein
MFDQVVTIWSLNKSDKNDFALVTFRGSLELSMAIARAGDVHVSRVANLQKQVTSQNAED